MNANALIKLTVGKTDLAFLDVEGILSVYMKNEDGLFDYYPVVPMYPNAALSSSEDLNITSLFYSQTSKYHTPFHLEIVLEKLSEGPLDNIKVYEGNCNTLYDYKIVVNSYLAIYKTIRPLLGLNYNELYCTFKELLTNK